MRWLSTLAVVALLLWLIGARGCPSMEERTMLMGAGTRTLVYRETGIPPIELRECDCVVWSEWIQKQASGCNENGCTEAVDCRVTDCTAIEDEICNHTCQRTFRGEDLL